MKTQNILLLAGGAALVWWLYSKRGAGAPPTPPPPQTALPQTRYITQADVTQSVQDATDISNRFNFQ